MTATHFYKVERGETLSSIANKLGMSEERLAKPTEFHKTLICAQGRYCVTKESSRDFPLCSLQLRLRYGRAKLSVSQSFLLYTETLRSD